MARKTPPKSAPLRLEGALDIQHAAAHHTTLSGWLAQSVPAFALDLSAVTACDSAGLQLLCSARRSVLSAGRTWRLVHPSEPVLRACAEVAIKPEELGL